MRTAPLIAAAALFSVGAIGQVAEPQNLEITIDNVAGNVFVSTGPFTRAVLSIGDDGVFLVDGVFSDVLEENGPILRRLTDRPLKFVVNTHCHSDHSSSNAAYGGMALVVAHPNARKRLSTGTVSCPKAALPDVTIDGELSVYFNDEEIRMLSLPAGHTDSDVIVFFTKSNVVHTGDVFIPPAASFVDTSNGGTILGLIEELEYVLPQIPADARNRPRPWRSFNACGRGSRLGSAKGDEGGRRSWNFRGQDDGANRCGETV